MTARTVNGSIKIRERHTIFKETGSPFDATPIHSIKVGNRDVCVYWRMYNMCLLGQRSREANRGVIAGHSYPSPQAHRTGSHVEL